MSAISLIPPAPNCGDISPLTETLRPPVGLSREMATEARRLKRHDHKLTPTAIAIRLGGAPTEAVRQALATIRTTVKRPTRRTLNIGVLEHEFVMSHRIGEEPLWRTANRLFNELIQLRTENFVLLARKTA